MTDAQILENLKERMATMQDASWLGDESISNAISAELEIPIHEFAHHSNDSALFNYHWLALSLLRKLHQAMEPYQDEFPPAHFPNVTGMLFLKLALHLCQDPYYQYQPENREQFVRFLSGFLHSSGLNAAESRHYSLMNNLLLHLRQVVLQVNHTLRQGEPLQFKAHDIEELIEKLLGAHQESMNTPMVKVMAEGFFYAVSLVCHVLEKMPKGHFDYQGFRIESLPANDDRTYFLDGQYRILMFLAAYASYGYVSKGKFYPTEFKGFDTPGHPYLVLKEKDEPLLFIPVHDSLFMKMNEQFFYHISEDMKPNLVSFPML